MTFHRRNRTLLSMSHINSHVSFLYKKICPLKQQFRHELGAVRYAVLSSASHHVIILVHCMICSKRAKALHIKLLHEQRGRTKAVIHAFPAGRDQLWKGPVTGEKPSRHNIML